jgi:hypothetical protein
METDMARSININTPMPGAQEKVSLPAEKNPDAVVNPNEAPQQHNTQVHQPAPDVHAASPDDISGYVMANGGPVQITQRMGIGPGVTALVSIGGFEMSIAQAIQQGAIVPAPELAARMAAGDPVADQKAVEVEAATGLLDAVDKEAELTEVAKIAESFTEDQRVNTIEQGTDMSTPEGQRVHEVMLTDMGAAMQEAGYDPEGIAADLSRVTSQEDYEALGETLKTRLGEELANEVLTYGEASITATSTALLAKYGVNDETGAYAQYYNAHQAEYIAAGAAAWGGSTAALEGLIRRYAKK